MKSLRVGMTATMEKRITRKMVRMFGEISGDTNPAHFDEAYAATTSFGRCIAHGMIPESFFSGLLGMQVPGVGTIWRTKEKTDFPNPTYIGDVVTATVTITEVIPKPHRSMTIAKYHAVAKVGERVVVEQTGVAFVPDEAQKFLAA